MELTWKFDSENIDWSELSNLYKIAPLGDKSPENLELVFNNSMYKSFVFKGSQLVGVGRALADGVDCSYICDIAVHPEYQGIGLGKGIVSLLVEFSSKHKKIILYADISKEGFYKGLGFMRMNTAMAIFRDQDLALKIGYISET
jgi:ribosomal protein S18 acetylase RimI-like enzyme